MRYIVIRHNTTERFSLINYFVIPFTEDDVVLMRHHIELIKSVCLENSDLRFMGVNWTGEIIGIEKTDESELIFDELSGDSISIEFVVVEKNPFPSNLVFVDRLPSNIIYRGTKDCQYPVIEWEVYLDEFILTSGHISDCEDHKSIGL